MQLGARGCLRSFLSPHAPPGPEYLPPQQIRRIGASRAHGPSPFTKSQRNMKRYQIPNHGPAKRLSRPVKQPSVAARFSNGIDPHIAPVLVLANSSHQGLVISHMSPPVDRDGDSWADAPQPCAAMPTGFACEQTEGVGKRKLGKQLSDLLMANMPGVRQILRQPEKDAELGDNLNARSCRLFEACATAMNTR